MHPIWCRFGRRTCVNGSATFGRISQGWPFPPAPDADFIKSTFFIGRYREFAVFSSRDIRPVFIWDRVTLKPTNVGSIIECSRDVLLRSAVQEKADPGAECIVMPLASARAFRQLWSGDSTRSGWFATMRRVSVGATPTSLDA